VIAPTASREVKDVGMKRLHSPPSCRIIPSSVEGNSFSQSQEWPVGLLIKKKKIEWPVGFDHYEEIVVWEKDDDYCVSGGQGCWDVRASLPPELSHHSFIRRRQWLFSILGMACRV
jgi:hypothetical protein